MRRWWAAAAVAALVASRSACAQREGVPLNDYTRLGQRFASDRPVLMLRVSVPSWLDAEGGLTLTLWDSPERGRSLASQAFRNVPDNASIELRVAHPVPAGRYYWEVSARTGSTKVGLYADPVAGGTDDCAFLDGVADRTRRFVFSLVPPDFVRRDLSRLVATLRSDAPHTEKAAACRELAVTGDAQAVPHLAALLSDPDLSHMARYALEATPYPSAAAALRKALRALKGDLLVGAMNSVGVRRDDAATPILANRLSDSNPEVVAASAAALGRIASERAARTLRTAFAPAIGQRKEALAEACLECARVMAKEGRTKAAAAIFDLVRRAQVADYLRAAGLRGAISARGVGGTRLLVEHLRGRDPELAAAALWLVARGPAGTRVTIALANAIPTLARDRRASLITALAARGDRAALPAVVMAAREGEVAVRLAAINAMPVLGGAASVATLLDLIGDPGAAIGAAARAALGALSRQQVEEAVGALLDRPDVRSQMAGMDLASQRGLRRIAPRLIAMARRGDGRVRLASLHALRGLAGAPEVAELLSLVLASASGEEADAAEQALTAACQRSADASHASAAVSRALSGAEPPRMPALIRVLGALGGEAGLAAVRGSVRHADPRVKGAALDALCEWPTADAAPDLLEVARPDRAAPLGIRCIRGVLRMAANPELSREARLALCVDAELLITRDEERRVLLGTLAGIPLLAALDLARPHLDSATTRAEACEAVLGISTGLGADRSDPRVEAALEKVAAYGDAPQVARRAAELLTAIRGGVSGR